VKVSAHLVQNDLSELPEYPPRKQRVRRWLADPSGFGVTLFVVLVCAVVVDGLVSPLAFSRARLGLADQLLMWGRDMLGAGVLLVLLLGARRLWLNGQWSRKHPTVSVLTVLVASSVALVLVERLLGVNQFIDAPQATVARTALLFTVVTVVSVVVINATREHRETMGRLRHAAEALEATANASVAALSGERARVYARIATAFSQMVHDAKRSAAPLAQELNDLAEDVLRPLSRTLGANQDPFVAAGALHRPAPRLRQQLEVLLSRPLIRPNLFSAAVLFLLFRQSVVSPSPDVPLPPPGGAATGAVQLSVDWDGIAVFVVTLLVVTVSVYVVATVLQKVLQRVLPLVSPQARWLVALAAIVAIAGAALAGVTIAYSMPFLPGATDLLRQQALLGLVLPLSAVMIASTILDAVWRLGEENQRQIAAYNRQLQRHVARTNLQLTHERRSIARQVHNTVQASVSAARLTLDRLSEPDPVVFDTVTGRIADAVEQLRADAPAPGLAAQLDGLDTLWAGVATVTWSLDVTCERWLDADAVLASLVADIIYEGCANAVVHGQATQIDVTVGCEEEDDSVTVTVRDNGVLSLAPLPGMGSQILATVCTRWDLASTDNGTQLTAVLPRA
jgi:signal transduction histidine kinase